MKRREEVKYKVGDEVAYVWYGKLSTGIVERTFADYDGDFCIVSGEKIPIHVGYLIPSPIAKINERMAELEKIVEIDNGALNDIEFGEYRALDWVLEQMKGESK